MKSKPEIFISYAWGEDLEIVVNQLYDNLSTKGYNIIRDKVNLRYKGNIKQFMQSIGAGKAVIIVLSEKYLKSKNCMFEAMEIRDNGKMEERIFPVVLSDANIYDVIVRLKFRKYWDDKIIVLNEEIRQLKDFSYISQINNELNQFSEIKRFIDEFMSIVANMNVLTPDIHRDSDFRHITDALDTLFMKDEQSN